MCPCCCCCGWRCVASGSGRARLLLRVCFGRRDCQLLFHLHEVVHAAGGAGEAQDAFVDLIFLAEDAAFGDVEPHGALHEPADELRFDLRIDRREHLIRDFDRRDVVRDVGELVVSARLQRL